MERQNLNRGTAHSAAPSSKLAASSLDPALRGALKKAFRLTIRLASLRLGATWPNPPVGCAVLDRQGNVLAIAAHQRAGEQHAEILALETLSRWHSADKAAYLLVTLEPCSHHGRTPPCVEALLKTDIPEIWIGAPDPSERAGGGADLLEKAGKKVIRLWKSQPDFKEIARDCQALITPFTVQLKASRPWIIAKQALDENGEMKPPKGKKTFTSAAALQLAHLLRRSCGGIVTGRGTILADQPLFTIRHIPDFDSIPERIIIACGKQSLPAFWIEEKLSAGFKFLQAASPEETVKLLSQAGVDMALIEAGPQLLDAFLQAGLVDEILRIHKRPYKDWLDWKKISEFSSYPSPMMLLEKYSPDWPSDLSLDNKKRTPLFSNIYSAEPSFSAGEKFFLWLLPSLKRIKFSRLSRWLRSLFSKNSKR